MAEHEPQPKRQKLSSIFEEFRKDKALIEILRDATNDLIAGYSSGAQFLFHEITEANARSKVAFTDASCDLEPYIKDPGAVAAGLFFKRGIAILKNYCDGKETESDIPKDPNLQNCLAKLLEFLSSDNGVLMFQEKEKLTGSRCVEGKWAVIVAQHLLSQLAVDSKYKIDRQYAHLDVTSGNCFCEKEDVFRGSFDDTSYGCETGWSGRTDVILDNNIKIQFSEEEEESVSVNSFDNVNIKSESQLVAQTVVFSFLEKKTSYLDNYLVPGIMIGKEHFRIMLYDSENDVLVSNLPNTVLFTAYDDLSPVSTLLLWLALNYRFLCTGVPSDKVAIDRVKANFFDRVGNYLASYQEKVFMPAHSRSSYKSLQNRTFFAKLKLGKDEVPDIPSVPTTCELSREKTNNVVAEQV